MKEKIENVLVIGDSLTDRGTMAKSALAAFSGLVGTSPHGRFTNGYVWLDYFIQQVVNDGTPPALIPPQAPQKKSIFSVNNDEYVGTKSTPVFARTYCKGGMTAFDYSRVIRPGQCILNAEAQVLATLDSMRDEALTDDEFINRKQSEKLTTLVIEWSGANDLITINSKPTKDAAELAVDARMENLEAMIAKGYQHFVLFNLPDLSLTPRFQNGHADLREQAKESVAYFNEQLQAKMSVLAERHPDCKFNIFDANGLFVEAYDNPEKFGLEKDKRHQPFLESRAFKDNDPRTTAQGYMFWDEVHPTEALHVQLATFFYQQVFSEHYEFSFAKQSALRKFQQEYGMRWEDDSHGTCGWFRKSRIDYLSEGLTLENIIEHGLNNKGHRTRKVMETLGWIHRNGECASDNSFVAEAYHKVKLKDVLVVEDGAGVGQTELAPRLVSM